MRMWCEFEKTATVRHLGLLDLQRTMQRALRRSALPVAYSNGFNPHMLMSFASALSSGIPGDAEIMEVRLSAPVDAQEALCALRQVLPPSLPVRRIRLVEDSFPKAASLMKAARYELRLESPDAPQIARAVGDFCRCDVVEALKKSKSREERVNIRPLVRALTVERLEDGLVILQAVVSFSESASLRPDLLCRTLLELSGVQAERVRIFRRELLTKKDGQLVPLFEVVP